MLAYMQRQQAEGGYAHISGTECLRTLHLAEL